MAPAPDSQAGADSIRAGRRGDLNSVLSAWLEAQAEVESAEEKRDEYAEVLERRAHVILKDRHAIRRTGQHPRLRSVDGDRLYFEVSNGIDDGDDFGAYFTLDELKAYGDGRLFHPSEYSR